MPRSTATARAMTEQATMIHIAALPFFKVPSRLRSKWPLPIVSAASSAHPVVRHGAAGWLAAGV